MNPIQVPCSCLPDAGGIGTILFTIGGIVLIGAAAVLLIVLAVLKKPKDENKKNKRNGGDRDSAK